MAADVLVFFHELAQLIGLELKDWTCSNKCILGPTRPGILPKVWELAKSLDQGMTGDVEELAGSNNDMDDYAPDDNGLGEDGLDGDGLDEDGSDAAADAADAAFDEA